MAENQIVQNGSSVPATTVKDIVTKSSMVTRFADVLGGQDKANQFLASLVSAVNGSANLQKCRPMAVIECAMTAAALNLDINPNLGFASIVPYKTRKKDENGEWYDIEVPQFQMGWKGFVQLAMRTGQYRTMNVTEVYADEFESYNPFTGDLKFHLVSNGDRDSGRIQNVVGYAFYFELVSGFSKMSYMSMAEAINHAKRFSKAFQNDLKYKTQTSPWSTMFDAMAKKTIVKNTLSKFGVLSTQMSLAQRADQSTQQSITKGDNGNLSGDFAYDDNDIVDVPEETPKKDKASTFKEKHGIGKEAEEARKEEQKTEEKPVEAEGPETFEEGQLFDETDIQF